MDLSRLRSALERPSRRSQRPEIATHFRAAAIKLTELLKASNLGINNAFEQGYNEALNDVLDVVLQTGLDASSSSGISHLIDWIEARQESMRSDASEADEDEERARRASPPTADKLPLAAPSSPVEPRREIVPESSTAPSAEPTVLTPSPQFSQFTFESHPPVASTSFKVASPAALEQRKRSTRQKRKPKDVTSADTSSTSNKRSWYDTLDTADIVLDEADRPIFPSFWQQQPDIRPAKRTAR